MPAIMPMSPESTSWAFALAETSPTFSPLVKDLRIAARGGSRIM